MICVHQAFSVLSISHSIIASLTFHSQANSVLFKKFADIDVFDIEVDTQEVDEFVQTVKNIAPTCEETINFPGRFP
jgi:malic enzyme